MNTVIGLENDSLDSRLKFGEMPVGRIYRDMTVLAQPQQLVVEGRQVTVLPKHRVSIENGVLTVGERIGYSRIVSITPDASRTRSLLHYQNISIKGELIDDKLELQDGTGRVLRYGYQDPITKKLYLYGFVDAFKSARVGDKLKNTEIDALGRIIGEVEVEVVAVSETAIAIRVNYDQLVVLNKADGNELAYGTITKDGSLYLYASKEKTEAVKEKEELISTGVDRELKPNGKTLEATVIKKVGDRLLVRTPEDKYALIVIGSRSYYAGRVFKDGKEFFEQYEDIDWEAIKAGTLKELKSTVLNDQLMLTRVQHTSKILKVNSSFDRLIIRNETDKYTLIIRGVGAYYAGKETINGIDTYLQFDDIDWIALQAAIASGKS
ncbi:MAG: hypothetical protein PHQ96_02630, partial [Candidatus Omnitrophica bacterium]|nr:hypothetical protein [Candidatus Omnitrophota bacterium]